MEEKECQMETKIGGPSFIGIRHTGNTEPFAVFGNNETVKIEYETWADFEIATNQIGKIAHNRAYAQNRQRNQQRCRGRWTRQCMKFRVSVSQSVCMARFFSLFSLRLYVTHTQRCARRGARIVNIRRHNFSFGIIKWKKKKKPTKTYTRQRQKSK